MGTTPVRENVEWVIGNWETPGGKDNAAITVKKRGKKKKSYNLISIEVLTDGESSSQNYLSEESSVF